VGSSFQRVDYTNSKWAWCTFAQPAPTSLPNFRTPVAVTSLVSGALVCVFTNALVEELRHASAQPDSVVLSAALSYDAGAAPSREPFANRASRVPGGRRAHTAVQRGETLRIGQRFRIGWQLAFAAVSRRPPISLYRIVARTGGLPVRRESLGIVHRSKTVFCRPVPNPNRPIRSFHVTVRLSNADRLESAPKAAARWVLEVSAGLPSPSSKPRAGGCAYPPERPTTRTHSGGGSVAGAGLTWPWVRDLQPRFEPGFNYAEPSVVGGTNAERAHVSYTQVRPVAF
jgi:hypothetical protein